MKLTLPLSAALSAALLLSACDKKNPSGGSSDHGHDHAPGEVKGVIARVLGPDGVEAGHLELVLHDDKGDLEVRIAKDSKFETPFDLPLDTKITVTFKTQGEKSVTMAVRNRDKNEDEAGKANIRNGKTNYFIFPGETGQDASWLKGEKFESTVRVTFEADGKAYATSGFVLKPHAHAGGDHKH